MGPDDEEWFNWPVWSFIGKQSHRVFREALQVIKVSENEHLQEIWSQAQPYMRAPQMGSSVPTSVTPQMVSRLMVGVAAVISSESKDRWVKELEKSNSAWRKKTLVADRKGEVHGSDAVDRFLSTAVHYLGPLRMGPRTATDYELRGAERLIGPEGQHLAYQLMVNPKVWGFKWKDESHTIGVTDELTLLSDALSYWAQELGIATAVRGVEAPGVGDQIKLRVADLDLEVSPNDVGVGVSQTLPVLAVVLLASPGDLIVLEQPELHLHPSSQLQLARFFVAAIRSGRRLLIESHSEHFLNQLRLEITRASKEDSEWLAESVGFIFAEKSEDGATLFKEVPLSPDGTLALWPKGFFDQGSDVIRQMIQLRRQSEQSR